jgi:hypothetical protein
MKYILGLIVVVISILFVVNIANSYSEKQIRISIDYSKPWSDPVWIQTTATSLSTGKWVKTNVFNVNDYSGTNIDINIPKFGEKVKICVTRINDDGSLFKPNYGKNPFCNTYIINQYYQEVYDVFVPCRYDCPAE